MRPYLQPTRQSNVVQNIFLGLDTNLRSDTRGWHDMANISPRDFPIFSPRAPRGVVATLTAPAGILARDALVYVDGATLYIGGKAVAGLTLTTSAASVPKSMVSMGAYIIIMPDKKYVNTADLTDYGSIDSTFTFTGDVLLTPSRVDGTTLTLGALIISVSPPIAPANGDYWVDISGDIHVLRQYSATSDVWAEIPSTYTRIDMAGIGDYFQQYDGVTLSGLTFAGTDPVMAQQIAALNANHIIYAIGANSIVVTGLLNEAHTLVDVTVTVKRKMPDVDFLTESENRLWGCKYGIVDGKNVNEIYACEQGNFRNWTRYMGISTDSYAASVGKDGKFTGAITHLGYPIFFKETCLIKVYGSQPSNYRIETTDCRGVQEGSHRSLAIVNEMLYYKGRTDVLAYDGSLPVGVGDALGSETYRKAVAGVYKERYYINMQDTAAKWHLFLYDTQRRLWYREDDAQVMGFAQVDDELYYIDTATRKLVSVYGTKGTSEGAVVWSATTGIIGYEHKDHKYLSRFNLRVKMDASASFRVYLRYDSDGEWEKVGDMRGTGITRTFMLPVRPRRCDHLEMKLSGTGDVRIFSIARILEVGSDG